jgi:hypothetical protein
MKLHEDRDAFQALLSNIGKRTGIREDIIEKDYYLTMLLKELGKSRGRYQPISRAVRHFIRRWERWYAFQKISI